MSVSFINDYWQAGMRVFPLHDYENGLCGCGDPECEAILKHPIATSWQHTPDWSDEQMENICKYSLTKGFGVLCEGYLVIDVDSRNGGMNSYQMLCDSLGIEMHKVSGFVVNTGSGGGSQHIYFKAPEGVSLKYHHDAFPGIEFKSSGFVVGAGSLHKSGGTYEVEHGHPDDIKDAPEALIEALKRPEYHRASINGTIIDVNDAELVEMLSHVDSDCDYDKWIKIGMALHEATHGVGIDLWDAWSNNSSKYPGRHKIEHHWHSFGKSSNPVTVGTLMHHARAGGYVDSVTFPSESPEEVEVEGHPFSVEGVDVNRPPGFVGEVCEYINSQCRYPREKLAAIASIVAVGNVGGLRYIDEKDGVTGNLFAFCVSGSGTGKEAVLQSYEEIMRFAGISAAMSGEIKSTRGIYKDLMRHQAAFYSLDELGYVLQKASNGGKAGGASHMEGAIGVLMQAYSKATGYMGLSGDAKEEVRKELIKEKQQCQKAVAENEDPDGKCRERLVAISRALGTIDYGIERPFLSMIGFTTPVTFDALVTGEQASNGFIARAILVREKETNPRRKRGFKKKPMPMKLRSAIQNLYSPGAYDSNGVQRVENYSDPIEIPTQDRAAEMLEDVADFFEELAEHHKSASGHEAIVRRAYELVSKVSFILAMPEGMRTPEHVRWAYKLVRDDIDEKIQLAYGNEMEGRTDGNSRSEALLSRILSLLGKDEGETLAVITNRLKKYKREDVATALANMEQEGVIEQREVAHPRNGKITTKWYLC